MEPQEAPWRPQKDPRRPAGARQRPAAKILPFLKEKLIRVSVRETLHVVADVPGNQAGNQAGKQAGNQNGKQIIISKTRAPYSKRNRERTKERRLTYTYITRGAVRWWGAWSVAVYDERDVLQSAPMTPPEGGVGRSRQDLRIPVLDLGRRCSLVRKHKFRGSRPSVSSRSRYMHIL